MHVYVTKETTFQKNRKKNFSEKELHQLEWENIQSCLKQVYFYIYTVTKNKFISLVLEMSIKQTLCGLSDQQFYYLYCFYFSCLRQDLHSVMQAVLELTVILLPQPTECWEYGYVLLCPT